MQPAKVSSFDEFSGKTAWKRDALRVRLTPARSIEETGLDPSLHGDFLSPHGAPPPNKEIWRRALLGKPRSENLTGKECCDSETQIEPAVSSWDQQKSAFGNVSDSTIGEGKGGESLLDYGRGNLEKRRFKKGRGISGSNSFKRKHVTIIGKDGLSTHARVSGGKVCDSINTEGDASLPNFMNINLLSRDTESVESLHNETVAERDGKKDTMFGVICEKKSGSEDANDFLKNEVDEVGGSMDVMKEADEITPLRDIGTFHSDVHHHKSPTHVALSTSKQRLPFVVPKINLNKEGNDPSLQSRNASPLMSPSAELLDRHLEGATTSAPATNILGPDAPSSAINEEVMPSAVRKSDARSRWKRITHTVTLINHMAAHIRSASADLIEDRAVDEMLQQQAIQDDAGGVGAAAFEGARTVSKSRLRGRKGMEGLLVRQDRGFITFFQDFYVACLKMPIGHFLVGVFLAPVVLGLLFTPLYLLDVDGLTFNGVVPEDAETSSFVSPTQHFLTFLNVFLYALSLSTTFGGSPVAARSPFCLLLANVNTLMAQFLFVFLSGAVFARMSQPSYPIRCSKKAIIKTDDLLPVLGIEQQDKYKVFAVRLVLTGPSPCELIDAKICLTFRIFVTLPSGSVFCSTQDLEVVRSEVSYLRYGIMVRHIIDKKSPVYGHTMKTLEEGDASFSLTVMGMERSSMQPVFHLEDYFVCDGDVIWDGEYIDFIHINDKGQRVLDHSQIDLLKTVKAAARASVAISRMKGLAHQKQNGEEDHSVQDQLINDRKPLWKGLSIRKWVGQAHRRNLCKSKSASFTRADW